MRYTALTVASLLAGSAAAASGTVNGVSCPGALVATDGSGYCCVGGTVIVSDCPGWPICTGPTTSVPAMTCATTVYTTEKGYSSIVASASSKYLNGDGEITATAGAAAETSSAAETSAASTKKGSKSSASAQTTASGNSTASAATATASASGSSGTAASASGSGTAAASTSTGGAALAAATLLPIVGMAMGAVAALN